MRPWLSKFFKAIRITLAVCLISVSLWALLLPPAFPYSTHAVVNAKAVAIRAGERGHIAFEPTTRSTILQAGDCLASVTRDLAKEQRKLEEQNFTKLKLEGQLESLDEAIESLQQKLQTTKGNVEEKRLSSDRNLKISMMAAEEKVKIYAADLAEKIADQKRVEPLFEDGIVTAAQWSEVRQQKIESEKLLKAAEVELSGFKARLEDLKSGTSRLSDGDLARATAKLESYEQEASDLGLQRAELRTELDEITKQIESARRYSKEDKTYELTTPIKGVVWHRRAVDGEPLVEGQVVAEVADVGSLFVEAYFRQDFLNQIEIGDHATIYLVGETRFIDGKVVDIQVQESTAREEKLINTVKLDISLLNVKIEAINGNFEPKDLGQLAKVLVSSGHPSWIERFRIWSSLILRSHNH